MVKSINDFHVHVGPFDAACADIRVPQLLKYREKYNIDKTIILSNTINEDLPKICMENDWLYGLSWITNRHDLQIPIEGKIIGAKFHGFYLNYPVSFLTDRLLESLRKKILLVHCGRYLEGDIKSNTSYLHALNVARNYPDIKIVLAHMGGTDTTVCKKAIEHGSKYHNVYYDTSGITTPIIIEYALNKLPSTRVLFGSDIPWCSFNAMYYTVMDSAVSDLSKQDILHDNFELLRKR